MFARLSCLGPHVVVLVFEKSILCPQLVREVHVQLSYPAGHEHNAHAAHMVAESCE